MTDAKRDSNMVPTLIGVSSADGTTPTTIYVNPSTHRMLVSISSTLDALLDVVITSAAQGDILYYNGTDWVNLAAGTSGKFLKTQGAGANPMWDTTASGAAGSDTQVQFNDGGANLGGDAGLTYNKTTDALTVAGVITSAGLTSSAVVKPSADDAAALGVSGTGWSDLFLASGAVINFNAADVTITHSLNLLALFGGALNISFASEGLKVTATTDNASIQVATFEGDRITITDNDAAYISLKLSDSAGNQDEQARITWQATTVANGATQDGDLVFSALVNNSLTTMLTLDGSASEIVPAVKINSAADITGAVLTSLTGFMPDANDGAYLGQAGTAFSDLFLAEGGVINWDSGDATITQTGNILAVAGADLRVATAGVGTDADSVPTLSSTSTLTNKTLTSPTLTTPSAFTTGGTITLAENTSIALDPAGSADGKYTGITIAGTAGEALAFGDVIVLDVTAGKWFKASVSAAAGADGDLRGGTGMCVLAAAGDASATTVLLMGTCRADANFPALTIGSVVYATTTGDITVTQPSTTDHIIKVLGYALTADEIFFNPSMDYITHT